MESKSWITYLLEMKWVWNELSLSTERRIECDLIIAYAKESQRAKSLGNMKENPWNQLTSGWNFFSPYQENSIESN